VIVLFQRRERRDGHRRRHENSDKQSIHSMLLCIS
jgi:hypothetical protein